VNWDRIDRGRRPDFRVVRSAPVAADYAVPRGSTGTYGAPSNADGRHATPIVRVGSNSGTRSASRGFIPAGVLPSRAGAVSTSSEPSRMGSFSAGPAPSRAGAPPSPPDGRSVAVPRGTTPPRYVNRGNDIIRSQTERPIPPRPEAIDRRIPGTDGPAEFARPRTAPDGPARRVAPAPGVPSSIASPVPSPSAASPSSSGAAWPSRERQPAYTAPDVRGYRTRPSTPDAAPRPSDAGRETPGVIERHQPARGTTPQNYGRPRGYEPRPPSPAPTRVEAPQRAAPAPPAPEARPRETAVPRQGSAGGGAGTRSRGRGGA